jgi:hypothetical protein
LFEAGFLHEARFARCDIIEVKSTTSVKEIHLSDLSFQSHVSKAAGVPLHLPPPRPLLVILARAQRDHALRWRKEAIQAFGRWNHGIKGYSA